MKTDNEIRLRLRFFKDVEDNIDVVRQKFVDYAMNLPSGFLIKIRPNHIQFTIQGEKQKYWSPHLSIELEEKEGNEKNATHIRGLFGPAQTLWTFFMFLHFIVAGIFTLFGMFAYSNYTLKEPMMMDFIIMFFMVFIWFLLYIIARQTRKNGYGQMEELEREFEKIIES